MTVTARQRALALLEEHGVLRPPVPIDRLVKATNTILQYVPLDVELSGMAFEKGGQAVVAVNALHHPNRQRFTIAHELAHVILHREHISEQVHVDREIRVKLGAVLRRDELAASGTDALEIEANAFAAELLMPRDWITAELQGDWDIDDGEKITSLARKFKVSVAAMQFRLLDLL